MSRLPRAGTAGRPVTIRATGEERERWQRCADFVGLDLSTWIRRGIERQCGVVERSAGWLNAERSKK